MPDRVHHPPGLIYSVGTQVVSVFPLLTPDGEILHPAGAVGVIVKSPADLDHAYRVRFPDQSEFRMSRDQVTSLAVFKEGQFTDVGWGDLSDRIIFRCIIGSRAYGLDGDTSDTDRRGIFLPTAERHWSLAGVPEQLENDATQEAYWELEKFLVMALKANPNVLECLNSPLVEFASPLANELLAMRDCFLSKLVYQTYNGYVLSQFKKMQADLRNHGSVKWKHVMHLLRLLLAGITVLREHIVPVRVDSQLRDRLLAIRHGERSWDETESWRLDLHRQFDDAFQSTTLPDRPDYLRVNDFLVNARRRACVAELP